MDAKAPQNGRKRRRSTESEQAVLPNSITSNTNKRTFEVFNDADNADESVDMPRKKMRKDSTALQAVSPRILNTGISPVQDAFSNMQLQQKTAPSLKNRSAFTNPNLTHEFGTQRNQLLQSTRAMLLSSLNGDLMSPLSQPPSRSLPKARNDENRPVSTLLGSPFHPTVTKSRQSSHSSRLRRALLHRPSDGAIPRYPIFKRDQHRRPSDVYMRVHRDSSLSYMKQLSPRKKSELKRDDSFWANLQQNAFKTPPKRQESLDSLFITGSDATILPIPHKPIHLDTPINETDQLVADMSGFSLDPKPGKGKEISGIFSHTTSGKRKNKRDIRSTDEPQINSPTAPASGPEPPRETLHSPKGPGAPLPIKATTSSSDPLDLLHTRPPGSKRIEARQEVENHFESSENYTQQGTKKSKRVYGKWNKQKSVKFTGSPDHKIHVKPKGAKERVKGQPKVVTRSKRTSSDDRMDTSDDELLLK